ncbi:hypothetical protein D3C80_1305390 [compost metagenome]
MGLFLHLRHNVVRFGLAGSGKCWNFRDIGTVLETFEIIKNGLLDQPVRRAIDTLCCAFDAIASCLVELYAHGGSAHANPTPVFKNLYTNGGPDRLLG